MNGGVDPFLYGLTCGATVWLGVRWLGARCRLNVACPVVKTAGAVLTAIVLLVPIGELPLWKWAFSVCPNPSLPMLGMICAALWPHLGGRTIFKPADWRMLIGFGAGAGTLLYLHPVFLPSFDFYYWGWHHEVAVWGMATLALTALACGNRGGVLFLAALIAYELEALESHNGWDYLVDPIHWLICLGLVAAHGVRRWKTARAQRRASRSPFPTGDAWESAR